MESNRIREVFFDFFASRDHTVVPSASLIPTDPTLLLTNAGMVPFKPYLLGEETPPYVRAVSIQKCARTVDIDIVGTTARHLTMFEMMGNFSFGDYFKELAIPFAYELVTDGFGLDPERLWYTVHETDDDAEEIWIETVGVRPDRVQRRGKDNFWQMGVPGPCGPSSEIFYDKGSAYGPDGGPIVDEERFMEFWNLVFMQHVQDEPYNVIGDLPARNIDTGAGLERVSSLLQGVETVFETDLVRPIMAAAERLTGVSYGHHERSDVGLRILADHAKSVTLLISDKVVPSNEGRGYVLRRLLRRAVRHAAVLGSDTVVMPSLIDATIEVMGEAYPELKTKRDAIAELAEREEVRFRQTLASGHQLLDEELARLDDGSTFPGAAAFKLHDTYGFPRELTEEILAEKGIALDLAEFHRMMDEQRERARASFKGGDAAARSEAYRSLLTGLDGTDFVGYEHESTTGTLLTIVREGETVERADEGHDIEVFCDRTPFYAESGGQIGDAGTITTPTGTIKVRDTQFALPGLNGHRGTVVSGHIQVGQEVDMRVASERRERIRKNHTGTHLLHWALREIIGDHSHQEGSLVADDRLRFDFSHYAAVDREQLRHVEQAVNEKVIENAEVTTLETTKAEAEKMGALAFFGDKYGDRVRVVRAGDYSTEFCGGTHVHTTGQVGPLIVVSEGSVAANTRRVEALTGVAAFEYLSTMRRRLEDVAGTLNTQPNQIESAAETLVGRLRDQEERLERFEAQVRGTAAAALLDQAESVGRSKLIVQAVDGENADGLRALAFQVRDRLGSGIGILGSHHEGKGALVGWASDDVVAAGVSVGVIVGAAAKELGGGGSRDPKLAQAGGPRGDQLEAALVEAQRLAREALAGL